MNDETNPQLMFNSTHTELLIKIANGEIDAQKLAAQQLASRGLDAAGEWVGFDTAAKIHNANK